MSGIAPRRSNVVFDPLMNPGAASVPAADDSSSHPLGSGSLARVRGMPVEELKRMALSTQNPDAAANTSSAAAAYAAKASGAAGEEEVPIQRMSDFLAGAGSDSPSAAEARQSLFSDDEAAEAAQAKKKASLFADDDDDDFASLDPATRERKEKKRAAAAAAAAEKAKATAAAQAEAQARQQALLQSVSSNSTSPPTQAAASADSSLPVSKRAGGKDLFDATDDSASQPRGLKGVFIPKGAAEYHGEAVATEAVDPALLQGPQDDSDLDRLSGEGADASASRATAGGAASSAASLSAAAASASTDDVLDDDLFSFAAPSKPAASTVDASDPNFDFNSYLQQQRAQSQAPSTVSKGASLFDDDD